jgi:outer membrane biosynthesis protein TonB
VNQSKLDASPKAIRIAVPTYPLQALESGVGGWILITLLLDEQGAVINSAAIQSSEGLFEYRDAVAQAMLQSAFSPGMRDGNPVRTVIFQTVTFDPNAHANAEAAETKSKPKPSSGTKNDPSAN